MYEPYGLLENFRLSYKSDSHAADQEIVHIVRDSERATGLREKNGPYRYSTPPLPLSLLLLISSELSALADTTALVCPGFTVQIR